MPISQLPLGYMDPTGGLPPSMWGAVLAGLLAALGALLTWVKLFGRTWLSVLVAHRREVAVAAGAVLVAGSSMGILWFRGDNERAKTPPTAAGPGGEELPRVLILAFDGFDPRLLEQYMDAGRLPNFSKLVRDGVYHPLPTCMPPQSPVAWCTFLTGDDPGRHGVFDFIKRRAADYRPDLSLADRQKMSLPWRGTPFWERPTIARLGSIAQRLPMVFPPPKLDPKLNSRVLAGMGVWDVRGTEGTYFFYTTAPDDGKELRGMRFEFRRDGNFLHSELPGPYRAGGSDQVRESFSLELADGRATLKLQDKTYSLRAGRWSDWIDVEFGLGPLGLQKMRAVTRVLLRSDGDNVSLYVSPLNFDPRSPFYPISSPRGYSADLADEIGLYATRGMPFDTQAVNDGVLSDADFLEQVRSITDESEKMLFHELASFKSGLLFAYFEGSDVVQHMFWRGIDPEHPLYRDKETAEHRDAIPKFYEQCDAILGRAQAAMGKHGQVVVMSDHGFGPFRQSVHLNAVLRDLGFLAIRPSDADPQPPTTNHLPHATGGELLKGIDWSRTRAYALGLNAVYLNLAGREGQGIVKPEEAESLSRTIAAALQAWKDPETGLAPMKKVYLADEIYSAGASPDRPDLLVGYARGYRASWETMLGATPARATEPNRKKWSGDHCIDAAEVPGIFLSSDKSLDAASLAAICESIDRYLAARLSSTKASAGKTSASKPSTATAPSGE